MNLISKIFHSDKCIICYETYKAQDNECLLLKCRHIFHEKCIKEWFNNQHSCPICKNKAFSTVESPKEIDQEIKAGKSVRIHFIAFAIMCILGIEVSKYFISLNNKERRLLAYGEIGLAFGFMAIIFCLSGATVYFERKRNQSMEEQRNQLAEKLNYIPPDDKG